MTVQTVWDMICPKCNHDEQLDIRVSLWARLTPDGTDPDDALNGDTEWDEDSDCQCGICGFEGKVRDFKVE
jgi:hypothetical protein